MAQPLDGILVADFSHVMAGPYASHLLRLLGAEVIKIEAPGRGDAMRYYGPDRQYDGMAPAFIAVNAGKKSIVLNLKDPDDLETAKAIVARSDVLLENFRPGVLQRLGLGYREARELRQDIVYCSISGYGQTGELRDWPAIDNIVQATSGMMSLSGEADGEPIKVGFPAVDTLTGQTAAFAIVAALYRRERDGVGDYIDVAMLDASLAFMTSAVVPYLVTGKPFQRAGNTGFSGQPTAGLFEARDGRLISLGVVQQEQFVTLAKFLGKEEWLDEPAFTDPESRRTNFDLVTSAVGEVLKTKDAAEWEAEMSAARIPCGMVREVEEASKLAHLADRGATLPLTIPGLPENENVEIVNAGFMARRDGPGLSEPPPRLGEHTEEIMEWLGRSETNAGKEE